MTGGCKNHLSMETVITAFVQSRHKSQHVSTSEAIRAIRTLMPALDIPDRELTDLVAAYAIRQRYAVSFDLCTLRQSESS